MKSALIGVSLCMLALGIAAPRTALRSAHALVAILAVMLLVVLIQPALRAWMVSSARPFVPAEQAQARSVAPTMILDIAEDIARPSGVLSARARSRIRAVAVGRLLDHHRTASSTISLDDVRAIVSPTLAAIIADDDGTDQIPIGELDSLLTELERL